MLATVEICDRMEAIVDLGVPNYALVEYPRARELSRGRVPDVRGGGADHGVLGSGLMAQGSGKTWTAHSKILLEP